MRASRRHRAGTASIFLSGAMRIAGRIGECCLRLVSGAYAMKSATTGLVVRQTTMRLSRQKALRRIFDSVITGPCFPFPCILAPPSRFLLNRIDWLAA